VKHLLDLAPFKVHIIHVGNMANKGTQALLISDISVIKDVVKGDIAFSVSTTDVEGVSRLNLPLDAVLPSTIDIPYERADYYAKRFGFSRESFRYKGFTMASLILMPIQIILAIICVILVKLGLKAFYRSAVLERVKGSTVVISCSDENFKEGASLLPLNIYWLITWWSMLVSRTWEILIAKFLGKPVIMFPNSVGPFRTWMGRFLSKLALNRCDRILVREPVSYDIVESLGIKPPKILTTDTTLLFNSNSDVSLEKYSNPVIGVSSGVYSRSLSKQEVNRYILVHAKALDRAIEKYGFSIIFMPHYVSGFRSDDLGICKLVLSKMKNADKAKIVDTNNVEEFKALINGVDMVISSKMHPSVFAVSAFVPTLNVAYDHKQTGFFLSLGISDCVISVREISYKNLLSKIDYVWNKKDSLRVLLKKRVPVLQKHVKESIALAMASFIEANSSLEVDSLKLRAYSLKGE